MSLRVSNCVTFLIVPDSRRPARKHRSVTFALWAQDWVTRYAPAGQSPIVKAFFPSLANSYTEAAEVIESAVQWMASDEPADDLSIESAALALPIACGSLQTS